MNFRSFLNLEIWGFFCYSAVTHFKCPEEEEEEKLKNSFKKALNEKTRINYTVWLYKLILILIYNTLIKHDWRAFLIKSIYIRSFIDFSIG